MGWSVTPDLSAAPKEYHDFADVFSKAKASVLIPHQEYNLQIELEEGASPLPGRLYSLSPIELEVLWVFINENLCFRFIHPMSSPHTVPVLFVKKKDGLLQLYVNFQGLNKLSKKDWYPQDHPAVVSAFTVLAADIMEQIIRCKPWIWQC